MPVPASPERRTPTRHGTPKDRLRGTFADPVLRGLTAAVGLASLGRGAFFSLTVIYFTTIVGLSAAQLALILTVANALGLVASLAVGHLSDRVSARRLQVVFTLFQGAALAGYAFAADFLSALVLASLVSIAERSANSARSAIIARAFRGQARVASRAILRTMTNVGIAIGSSAAAIPLLINTQGAFRTAIATAGGLVLLSATQVARLPRRVDAVSRKEPTTAEAAAPFGRSPYRDLRYLVLTALTGIFAMQFVVAEVGIPQWITQHTQLPTVLVSVLLVTNTLLVICLQIPLSRGSDDVGKAGRLSLLAGVLMAAACGAYALGTTGPMWLGIVAMFLGMVAHTFAEILSSAAGWGLSFELADHRRAGAYQGVFSIGFSIATMIAPAVVTVTALNHGAAGWAVLAGIFLLCAAGLWFIARRAAPEVSGPGDSVKPPQLSESPVQ